MELVQGEDTLDLENRFTDLAKRDVGGNALKEDVCSASDCIEGDRSTNRHITPEERDLPSGIAEEKIIAVMTKEMTGSQ